MAAGAIFRPIDRHNRIALKRLSGDAVCLVVRDQVGSLRSSRQGVPVVAPSGIGNSAAQVGVPTWKIRQQAGHASDAMLSRYIRDGQLFVEMQQALCCDVWVVRQCLAMQPGLPHLTPHELPEEASPAL